MIKSPFSLNRKKRFPFFTMKALAQRTGCPEVVACKVSQTRSPVSIFKQRNCP